MTSPVNGVSAEHISGGVQAGDIHGNVSVSHIDKQNIFEMRADTPEERFRVGRSYLLSGIVDLARDHIRDAVIAGYDGDDAGYYWLLALCADQSFADFDEADHRALREAAKLPCPVNGEWAAAREALLLRLDAAAMTTRDGKGIEADVSAQLDIADKAMRRLSEARQSEMRRFLTALNSDLADGMAEVDELAELRQNRRGNGRRARVPLFFMSDPAPPVRDVVTPQPVRWGRRIAAVLGAALAGYGLVLTLIGSFAVGVPVTLGVLGTWSAGMVIGSRAFVEWRWQEHYYRRRWTIARTRARTLDVPDIIDDYQACGYPVGCGVMDEFITELKAVAQRHHEVPGDAVGGRLWPQYADAAVHDVVWRYARHQVTAESLDWLLEWHAADNRDHHRWRSGGYAVDISSRPLALSGCILGVVGIGFAWYHLVLLGPLLALLGLVIACRSRFPEVFDGRWYDHECREAEARYTSQVHAYDRRVELLRDRPTDAEMERWLNYDLRDLILDSLCRSELAHDQVLDCALLLEPTEKAARARIGSGPPRYSEYRVRLFMLSRGGVRYFRERLNFRTGDWNEPMRRIFSYDSISSVTATEKRVRYGTTDRLLTARQDTAAGDIGWERWYSTTFEMVLVAKEKIKLKIRNRDEDAPAHLPRLRLVDVEAAGMIRTLRVLESVAAEGREWLGDYERRRARGAAEYRSWRQA